MSWAGTMPVPEYSGDGRPPKRATLTNADGTFNHEKAILHNVKTHKYVFAVCVCA